MLLRGHTLHILSQEVRTDENLFVSYVRENLLDVVDCTPTQLTTLIRAGLLETSGGAPAIVLLGGEAMERGQWRKLAETEGTDFWDVYGLTECTMYSTSLLYADRGRGEAREISGGPWRTRRCMCWTSS